MASIFCQSAINVGGSGKEFEQTVYINATGWGAENPADRRGGLQSGKGLRGGVCMGLSIMYIAARADWSVFKNAIVTPGGLAHVRGLMNFHNESDRVGSINFGNLRKVYA